MRTNPHIPRTAYNFFRAVARSFPSRRLLYAASTCFPRLRFPAGARLPIRRKWDAAINVTVERCTGQIYPKPGRQIGQIAGRQTLVSHEGIGNTPISERGATMVHSDNPDKRRAVRLGLCTHKFYSAQVIKSTKNIKEQLQPIWTNLD